jgi:hypothetical protein
MLAYLKCDAETIDGVGHHEDGERRCGGLKGVCDDLTDGAYKTLRYEFSRDERDGANQV